MNWALVTGGSRGIGRAVCIHLARQGFNILINYKGNKEKAEETLAEVKKQGLQASCWLLMLRIAARFKKYWAAGWKPIRTRRLKYW